MNLAECIDVNIEESCDRLTKSLLDAAHQCIPSKIVTIRPNDKPWFNNYLRRLLRTKNRAHNTAKKSNNIETGQFSDTIGIFIIRKWNGSRANSERNIWSHLLHMELRTLKSGGLFLKIYGTSIRMLLSLLLTTALRLLPVMLIKLKLLIPSSSRLLRWMTPMYSYHWRISLPTA